MVLALVLAGCGFDGGEQADPPITNADDCAAAGGTMIEVSVGHTGCWVPTQPGTQSAQVSAGDAGTHD
jgi:hypothetical protein